MRDRLLTQCPAWCDGAHEDYTPRVAQPTGEVVHSRAIRADHDPAIELAYVTQRKRWRDHGPYSSTSPGRPQLRLAAYWATADLDGDDGDLLTSTISRGRDLIERLDQIGGAR